jgi:SanA protein
MKLALIKKGIPEANIVGDLPGFRTIESVVRAREIFDQSNFLVIS